jgi:hypothetical protein
MIATRHDFDLKTQDISAAGIVLLSCIKETVEIAIPGFL